MSEKKKEHLDCLIGEQLSSVIFVQDYLQLDFDGNILTCYLWPEVEIDNKVFKYGDIDFRNKLCSIISKIVRSLTIREGVSMQIIFESDDKILLSLDPTNQTVPEIAMFNDSDGGWSFF
jgi:hypothetical protein